MLIYLKEKFINYFIKNKIQIINNNQHLLKIYNKLNKKNQICFNVKIRAYNIKLLSYIKSLLEATNLLITSLDKVSKK